MLRYNDLLLKQFIGENNFDIFKTYNKIDNDDDKKSSKPGPKTSEIKRETRIVGKCKYTNCSKSFDTAFRELYKHKSFYCKEHKSIIANEKRVETVRENYGVDYITQVDEIKDKIKETNIDIYGASTPLQSPKIKEDIKNKHLENFGGTNPSQNPTVQVKKKQKKLDNGNIKYKGDYLKILLDDCDSTLDQIYEDIDLTRNTDIMFKCKCGKNHMKSFRNIENYGAFCEECQLIIEKERQKETKKKNFDYNNSLEFNYPDLLKEWNYDKNIDIDPKLISKFSRIRSWWICTICNNEWNAVISNRSFNKTSCPFCKNKTETILYDFLKKYNNVIIQYKQEWCKNFTYLPFDFCIEGLKIIIELDGRQHFGKIKKWISLEESVIRDRYKMKCANENGFSVIRIVQEDIWNNKYDWKKELLENIEKIKHEGKVQNLFMCKNCEYDIFFNFQ